MTTGHEEKNQSTHKGHGPWMLALALMGLVLMLAVTACGRPAGGPNGAAESPAEDIPTEEMPAEEPAPVEPVAETPAELPETIETVFLIEGMEEPVVIHLFRESGLPFHTYYTEDMVAETADSGEADGVRFITNYGGNPNPEAYVAVTFYHADAVVTSEAFFDLLTGDNGLLVSREVEWVEKKLPEELMYDWTLREYFFMDDAYTGAIYAGQHDGRFFHIDIHYPWEYGDGLEARAHVILENFTWTDTGQSLMP
ncbi:hypothetical protein [Anoxynatronum buryatiense]|uniref:Uncharacterized protein n=1 Tax=Anoxynatronum buryatiense TaxID=489973 RepID=A0AA45WX30_9CLOT|nr:hypothetical protein [Anoxynatronum buryatiense]SMP62699.1 hypothetical protein SAMN06296020_11056 [Anoxynatronum buryatiense]